METIAAFVDDPEHALRLLQPLAGPGTHWVLVGCAPKLTHRVSKWVAHSSREQWRSRWAAQLFDELRPQLTGARFETIVARRPLPEVVQQLQLRHGQGLRLIDARRPRILQPREALSSEMVEAPPAQDRWTLPVIVTSGLSLMLAFGD
jgi:hypothetical protein